MVINNEVIKSHLVFLFKQSKGVSFRYLKVGRLTFDEIQEKCLCSEATL